MKNLRKVVTIVLIGTLIVALIVLIILVSVKLHKKRENQQKQLASIYQALYLDGDNETDKQETTSEDAEKIKELNQQLEEANRKIEELQTGLEEEKQKNDKMSQQEAGKTVNQEYLAIKFCTNGKYYRDSNNIQFYSDPTCTVKLKDVRFMSAFIDYAEAENGLSIYCLRMDNGEICYCPQAKGCPNLVPEQ